MYFVPKTSHALGSVVNCIDVTTAVESDKDYDWTICGNARVVGCAAPSDATFNEFRSLNADIDDHQYNTPIGIYQHHCGFNDVVMTWTGTEYMSHLLKFNEIDIPDEGLRMLRLFTFYDWHQSNHYCELANDDDNDVKSFIVDFYEIWNSALNSLSTSHDFSDEECEQLWKTHYSHIVQKYGVDDLLNW